MAGGRLAVGAGNAAGFDIHTGVAIEFGGYIGQRLAIVIDADMVFHTVTIAATTKHGNGSSINCIPDKVIAVTLESINGDKETSRVDTTGVVFNSGDLDIRITVKLRTINAGYKFT